MTSKHLVRKEILEKRNKLSDEFIYENSKVIKEKLLNIEEYKNSDTIFIYMSFKGEVETRDIIIHAFEKNKKVAIPKVTDEEMEFYYIKSINETTEGYYGIQEPINQLHIAYPDQNTLMVMPGLAFDYRRHRIGYGKGFYDRYLAKNNMEKKIALAFDCQVLEEIPYNQNDVLPDIIITEKAIIN